MNALLLTVLLLYSPGFAEPGTQPVPDLNDLSWLAGTWKSPDGAPGPKSEETWSEPAAGAMVGTFRMHQSDQVLVYEFLMLEQTADTVVMQLRHFGPQMKAWEDEPIRLQLQPAGEGQFAFVNADSDKPTRIVYARNGDDAMAVTVVTVRDNQPEEFTLQFRRAPNGTRARAKWNVR